MWVVSACCYKNGGLRNRRWANAITKHGGKGEWQTSVQTPPNGSRVGRPGATDRNPSRRWSPTGKIADVEFLDQIITSIRNDPAPVVAVALAALIGTVAGSIILGLWGLFSRAIPKAIRVKFLPFCYGLFVRAQIRYRRWRSKQVMAVHLSGMQLTIPAQRYESFLAGNPLTTDRSGFEAVRPPEPTWLNGYYVATALETLSRDAKIVKARDYHDSRWPPQIVNYLFWPPRADWTPAEEAHEFETNGKCRAYQSSNVCPVGERFDVRIIRETVSIRERLSIFMVIRPAIFTDIQPPRERGELTIIRLWLAGQSPPLRPAERGVARAVPGSWRPR